MNILIWIIKTQFLNGMTKRQFPISKNEHPKEDRYDILGKVGKVLFVVCTFKKGNIVHIISADAQQNPRK